VKMSKPDLVCVIDVYGRKHRVRKTDLDDANRTQLMLYTAKGKPFSLRPAFVNKFGVTLHRDNIAKGGVAWAS
jgi:hypothetical protein